MCTDVPQICNENEVFRLELICASHAQWEYRKSPWIEPSWWTGDGKWHRSPEGCHFPVYVPLRAVPPQGHTPDIGYLRCGALSCAALCSPGLGEASAPVISSTRPVQCSCCHCAMLVSLRAGPASR